MARDENKKSETCQKSESFEQRENEQSEDVKRE